VADDSPSSGHNHLDGQQCGVSKVAISAYFLLSNAGRS
jgi:hypothetical protein